MIQNIKTRPSGRPSRRNKNITPIIAFAERFHEIQPRRLNTARLELMRRVIAIPAIVVFRIAEESLFVGAAAVYYEGEEEVAAAGPEFPRGRHLFCWYMESKKTVEPRSDEDTKATAEGVVDTMARRFWPRIWR